MRFASFFLLRRLSVPALFLTAVWWMAFVDGDHAQRPRPEPLGACTPNWAYVSGYTFIRPDLIDSRSAYAPYLLDWGSFYRDSFAIIDWQKKENVEEWAERFCSLPDPLDVEDVVYKVSDRDLTYLADISVRKKGSLDLGYPFKENSFAECIVYNGCTEVVNYLKYARRCETFAVAKASKWRLQPDNRAAMQQLIRVGRTLFNETGSHFLKLRYAYQMIRMAQYAGDWQQALDLFNDLMPKIDRRKRSIIEFWIQAHVAGALQQLGKYGDAAYRFSVVFQHCASKRAQAFESFKIRNDADWQTALHLCQNDAERATLYLLRAAKYQSAFQEDLEGAYAADPAHPQLTLLMLSRVQYFERRLLRTPATDRRFRKETLAQKQRTSAQELIVFQDFVRKVVKERKSADPLVWACINGYLEIIAKNIYAAERQFQQLEQTLPGGREGRPYTRQIEIWRTLAEINQLDTGARFDYARAAKIRSYKAFTDHPDLPLYMQDMLSAYYASKSLTGLSILSVYGPKGLVMNPSVRALDQMIRQAEMGDEDFIQSTLAYDTSQGRTNLLARLIEAKGIALLNQGNPEAALLSHRSMRNTDRSNLEKYSAFKESVNDGPPPPGAIDSLQLSRVEFVEKIVDFEQKARAYEDLDPQSAAQYYYLEGLGYYNSSWFGYEWEVRDYHRDGNNWKRLAQGPVFPLEGSYNGNYEAIDLTKALACFEKAYTYSGDNAELAAKILFMAARCEQKIWWMDPSCTYRPGSQLVPLPPAAYFRFYRELITHYRETDFYKQAVAECKWLKLYEGSAGKN